MRANDVRVDFVILNPRIATITDAQKIAALVDAMEELGGGWRPIETAPKDNSEVLVFTNNATMYVAYWYTTAKEWRQQGHKLESTPTHWMPLPAKPKEQVK